METQGAEQPHERLVITRWQTKWSRCALLFVLLVPSWVFAQPLSALPPVSGSSLDEMLNQRGDLTLRDISLSEALFSISEIWEVNLVFGKDLEGQVNGVFRDAPLRDVLDTLLVSNGYGYRQRGRSLVVMKTEELGDTNALFESTMIPLRGTISEDVVQGAKLLLSPQGRLQPIASARSLMVVDYPDRVKRVRDYIADLGQSARGPEFVSQGTGENTIANNSVDAPPFEVEYFSPQYVKASSIKTAIESVITGTGKVTVIEDENRMVVVDDAIGIKLARKAFQQLDIPRPQVRITALIYDINLDEMEKLGINWTHSVQGHYVNNIPQNIFSLDSTMSAAQTAATATATTATQTVGGAVGAAVDTATTATTGGVMRFATLHNNIRLDSVVNFLDETKGARLLADPSVAVIDREEARIKIVTEVPFQQLTQTSEGGDIGTTDFREAGITLTVTPQIADDGTIKMKVAPTFSVLAGFSQGQPIIDSREADTTVRVGNCQTLVIGGLRRRTENETVTGLPGLMHIKHIGKFFRQHDTTVTESELIVFLKPEIVTPASYGRDREIAAHQQGWSDLERLPWAGDAPFIPDCKDPFCPYHHPRPRPNAFDSLEHLPPVDGQPTPVEELPTPALGLRHQHPGQKAVFVRQPMESHNYLPIHPTRIPPVEPTSAPKRNVQPRRPTKSVLSHRPTHGRNRVASTPKAPSQSTSDWLKNLIFDQ